MPLFGCHREPAHCFGVILRNIFPGRVVSSHRKLGSAVALLGQLAQTVQTAARSIGAGGLEGGFACDGEADAAAC